MSSTFFIIGATELCAPGCSIHAPDRLLHQAIPVEHHNFFRDFEGESGPAPPRRIVKNIFDLRRMFMCGSRIAVDLDLAKSLASLAKFRTREIDIVTAFYHEWELGRITMQDIFAFLGRKYRPYEDTEYTMRLLAREAEVRWRPRVPYAEIIPLSCRDFAQSDWPEYAIDRTRPLSPVWGKFTMKRSFLEAHGMVRGWGTCCTREFFDKLHDEIPVPYISWAEMPFKD